MAGVAVGANRDGILKRGETGLAFRKIIQAAGDDPTLVLSSVGAQDWLKQIPEDRHRQHRDGQAVQEQSDFREQRPA